MARRIALALVALALLPAPLWAAEGAARPPAPQVWPASGPLGTFDRNSLRRGYQVYKEVCAACHGMTQLHFRMLGQAGGPEFAADEIAALAAEFQVVDGPDEAGDMFERPGLPRDPFPAPFPNEKAARAANGGAWPPDLSLITKARAGGADYLYALLTGYGETPPPQLEVPPGQYYNPWFEGHVIAMSPPLSDGLAEYADGTPTNARQLAYDVTQFLSWAAEPELEARKRLGLASMLYLLVLSGLLYLSMRHIWARLS